jgi:transcriptional regulator with XRE-family HTH domain
LWIAETSCVDAEADECINAFYHARTDLTMSDLLATIEAARFRGRLSQSEVARVLGVTQGHYSKVIMRRVPLTAGLCERMEAWLERQEAPLELNPAAERIHELVSSIRRECIELMHLVRLGDRERRP